MALRVLNIIHNLEIGGAQANLLNLACERRADVESQAVVCWKRSGPFTDRLEAAGVRVIRPEGPGLRAAWQCLTQAVRELRPTVLHAHMSDSAFWAARLAGRFGLPFVVTFQDGTRIVPEMAGWKWMLRRFLVVHDARRAAMNIGVSRSLRQLMLDTLGASPERVVYIPNCIRMPEPAAVAAADAARAEYRGTAPRILALGRYIATKGFDALIAQAPQLVARWPGIRIDIVGGGELEGELKRQVASLGLEASIHITGPTTDPASLLRAANLFVSTSHYEGTSLALLEAMSWGLPVVASDVPGNRDLVVHDRTGVMYPLGDGAALVAGIVSQLEDHARAAEFAANARVLVDAEFSSRAILGRHVEIYRAASRR
ncbi:MAG: glycosyltransferase [Alphaproteobacteria bacterium]|nr:glycosyltransferase [Alphaproteobacteria bacterium]